MVCYVGRTERKIVLVILSEKIFEVVADMVVDMVVDMELEMSRNRWKQTKINI